MNIAAKLSNDEVLTDQEEAYLKGFMDASSMTARHNTFESNSVLAAEYDRGYTDSISEVWDY